MCSHLMRWPGGAAAGGGLHKAKPKAEAKAAAAKEAAAKEAGGTGPYKKSFYEVSSLPVAPIPVGGGLGSHY